MERNTQRDHADDIPACGAAIDGTDISRFLAGFLLRLTALALAVALASIGHGVSSMDDVDVEETIRQRSETGAER